MGPWLILLALILALGVASALVGLPGRGPDHPDGTDHDFTENVEPGAHSCGPGYCRHWRRRCACGAERLAGFAAEEVR